MTGKRFRSKTSEQTEPQSGSPIQQLIVAEVKKKPKMTTKPATIDEIQKLIEATNQSLQNSIMTTISNEITSTLSSIKQRVEDIDEKLESKIQSVDGKIDNVQCHVDHLNNEIQRLNKRNELVIRGIPSTAEENLFEIFKTISAVIGHHMENVAMFPTLRRLQGKSQSERSNAGSQPDPILAQFIAPAHRDAFFRAYFKKLPLKYSQIGGSVDSRIYISENLSKWDAEVFKEARALVKAKIIEKAFTMNGATHIRIKATDQPIKINDTKQLQELTRN